MRVPCSKASCFCRIVLYGLVHVYVTSLAGIGSKFSGIELLRVSIYGPELQSGSWVNWLEPREPLKFFELF